MSAVVPGKVRQPVGALDLEVGAGGVDEHDVEVQVQQVRHRAEHLGGDLGERVEQEVHAPRGLIAGQLAELLDSGPFGDPAGRRELGARLRGHAEAESSENFYLRRA